MEKTFSNNTIQANTEDDTNTDKNCKYPIECFDFLDNWLKYDIFIPTLSIPQSRIGLINTLIFPGLIISSIFYYIHVNQDWIVSSEIISARPCSKFEFVCTNKAGCEINGFGVQTSPQFLKNKIPATLVYNKSYDIPLCHGLMEFADIAPKLAASNLQVLYPNTMKVFRRTLAFQSTDGNSAYVAAAYFDGNATKIKVTKFSHTKSHNSKVNDLILTRGSHKECLMDWKDPKVQEKEAKYTEQYMAYEHFFVPYTYVLVEPYVYLFIAEGSVFKINAEKMEVAER